MRRPIKILLIATVLATVQAVPAVPTDAAMTWANAATASIHPGVQTISPRGQCTANFVYSDGKYAFLGQAAHCTTKGTSGDINGCVTPSYPLGTKIRIEGATRPGVLVYSSWLTMQRVQETSALRCVGNDFALVRVDPADRGRVNPSIPFWGGPRGLGTSPGIGGLAYGYGDSGLRQGIEQLSPKVGVLTETYRGGWSHALYAITPGIPGDSGSAVLDSSGRALGVMSTIAYYPFPLENTAADIPRALTYMRQKTSLDAIKLVPGTEPFSGLGL